VVKKCLNGDELDIAALILNILSKITSKFVILVTDIEFLTE